MLSVTNQTSRGYLTHRSRNSKKLYLHFYYSNVLFILQAHPSSNVTSKPHAPRTQLNPPAYSFQRPPPPFFFPLPTTNPFLTSSQAPRSGFPVSEATSIQPKQPRSRSPHQYSRHMLTRFQHTIRNSTIRNPRLELQPGTFPRDSSSDAD